MNTLLPLPWRPEAANWPVWSSDNEDLLECIQIRDETADVKTFVFRGLGEDGAARRFNYLPGQFMVFEFPVNGDIVNRCYTLSSSPTRPDTVSITVKRVPGGIVSNWLHENFTVGATLNALGPNGDFSCFNEEIRPKYLLMSGGSGITPSMSMARTLVDIASTADIVFLHCARTPADIIFANELNMLAHNAASFQLRVAVDARSGQNSFNGVIGRLNRENMLALVPDVRERAVYNCGPALFMDNTRAVLEQLEFDMNNYFEESFNFETLMQNEPEVLPASIQEQAEAENLDVFKVQLTKQDAEFDCTAEQTVLAASFEAGYRWQFSCSNGVCGTCKTKKISGEVEMNHNGGIRPREVREGWFLPCCSKPLSNLVIEK